MDFIEVGILGAFFLFLIVVSIAALTGKFKGNGEGNIYGVANTPLVQQSFSAAYLLGPNAPSSVSQATLTNEKLTRIENLLSNRENK